MTTDLAFEAVRVCAIALLGGRVLQADRVSAGNGIVLDWRTVPCGEELLTGGDAFDTAYLFVALAGSAAALGAIGDADAREPYSNAAEIVNPMGEMQRALVRRRAGRCEPFGAGVLAKNGERYADCASCEAPCDGTGPTDGQVLGLSGGIVVAPVWGGPGALELRWRCPGCNAEVTENTTPLGSLAGAAAAKADPLCFRCRRRDIAPPPPPPRVPPKVYAYAPRGDGGRRRSFSVGPFEVYVEPHEDDAAQAAFTAALAAMATADGRW